VDPAADTGKTKKYGDNREKIMAIKSRQRTLLLFLSNIFFI
jgi:hypothetical protein